MRQIDEKELKPTPVLSASYMQRFLEDADRAQPSRRMTLDGPQAGPSLSIARPYLGEDGESEESEEDSESSDGGDEDDAEDVSSESDAASAMPTMHSSTAAATRILSLI